MQNADTKLESAIALDSAYVVPTFSRYGVEFVKGDGAVLVHVASIVIFDSSATMRAESAPSAAARTEAISDSGSAGPTKPAFQSRIASSVTPLRCR